MVTPDIYLSISGGFGALFARGNAKMSDFSVVFIFSFLRVLLGSITACEGMQTPKYLLSCNLHNLI